MTKLVKVKGHKRADGTRVTSYKRKMQGFQGDSRREHAKIKGRLSKAIREGEEKEVIRHLKRGVKMYHGDIGIMKQEKGKYRRGRKRVRNTNRKK